MGKLDEQRDFLCKRFPGRWRARQPRGFTVDVHIMDLQPVMAIILDKRFPQFDTQRVIHRVSECVRHHMNNGNADSRTRHTMAFVVLMDNPQYVPKNKAATQRSRDDTRDANDEDEAKGPHMDEQLYNELVAKRGGDTEAPFLDPGVDAPEGLTGLAVWRSVNLAREYRRLNTLALLNLEVNAQQVLVIDDGWAISTEHLKRVRREMIRNNGWEQRSAFERECLVHTLMSDPAVFVSLERLILYDDRQFARCGPSFVGEADIKMQAYLQPHNGAKRFLVTQPDTDALFILLAHMPYFLSQWEAHELDEVEIWLELQSPLEWKDLDRPYRFCDVKGLYSDLMAWFADEYPSVVQPLETFCALMLTPHTDFTHPFDKCLGLTVRTIWNAFSELHSVSAAGYTRFDSNLKKPGPVPRETKTVMHPQLRGILNDAVLYDEFTRQYRLRPESLSRFFYYLCQTPVMEARGRIGLPTLDVKAVLPVQHLLLCARELAERMDLYRAHTRGQVSQLVQQHHSDVSMSDLFDSPMAPTKALLSEPDVKAYLQQQATGLAALCAKTDAQLYGVLTRQAMCAFLRRLAWYMKMCRHGYERLCNATDCDAVNEEQQSVYGWRTQECRGTSGWNSNYNTMSVAHGQLKCYEIVECEQVIAY